MDKRMRQHTASTRLRRVFTVFYKHSVPTGLKMVFPVWKILKLTPMVQLGNHTYRAWFRQEGKLLISRSQKH